LIIQSYCVEEINPAKLYIHLFTLPPVSIKILKSIGMINKFSYLLALTLITSCISEPVLGYSIQDQQEEVAIGIRVAPPFVIQDEDGNYNGLTIALWEQIAEQLNIDFRYVEHDIQGLIDGAADGSLYASASALTITSDREEIVDFTHPFFVTGLGIAVSYQPAGIWQSFMGMFSFDFLWVILLLLLLLLFWGGLVWIFERHENQEEFGGSASEGIGSGFWWAAVTMTTVGYGDKSPRTTGGRVVGFIWMFTAIIVISFFTASIASSLTVTQLDSRVSGPEDLPFVRVGTLEHSATMDFLDDERIRANAYSTIQEGLTAVEENEIDAFVHDAPIIQYYSQLNFRNKVRVLPNTFNDQYYGIAMPLGADYRNEMNRIILDYIAGEEWNELTNRFLGD
jgi:polar amino acid transport system substrate-binding protein